MVASARPPSKRKATRGKDYLKGVFAVNTSMCRSELELIQHVIQLCGFMETTLAGAGNLYWFGLGMSDRECKLAAKKQFYYNRYPGSEFLARKKVSCIINNRMRRTYEDKFRFSPISFLFPEEEEALEAYMKKKKTQMFIGKPSKGKGGEGIFLISKMEDIPNREWTPGANDLLVQRYVKNVLLIDQKKFDLRIYVLIKGFNPIQAYVCEEGLGRFCTENYKPPTKENLKNMFMHLTNYSLNKNSENYQAPDGKLYSHFHRKFPRK